MPLQPGVRLGPYEIVAALAAGGMGEVYRARDTRLDRIVAVKVLPSHLATDPQLRERFDREARAISSLNHPHICALFDVGHSDVDYLVLEFLEGQTLADRLAAGPLPVSEALRYAMEIADALDRAHRAGIVHRDLKPANVMITKSGAKLLDFGLAKTAAPVVATSGLSMMPTTPPGVTAQGTILGTFQYMAPEQIEGLEADARTDIFAFGALLFEMLTGRTAFQGKTRASLLGAILKDEPPRVSSAQPLAPNALDRIVATCLAKDPDDRWQSARDVLHELQWIASGGATEGPASEAGPAEAGHDVRQARVAWAVAGLLGLALAAAAIVVARHVRESPLSADTVQFTIPVPETATLGGPPGGGTGVAAQLAVSPDGRYLAFVAGGPNGFQLWLRSMGSVASRPLPGTEDASFPFWSPDSRFIGFFAAGKMKKVDITGGPPIVLCGAGSGRGGTWNRDNIIVFSPMVGGALQRVSGAGGVPIAASELDKVYGETGHRWPRFLPDGHHFLYTAVVGACCPPSKPAVIRIGQLGSTTSVTLFPLESSVTYASGHLLFSRDGTLMAQRFDPDARKIRGDPFPIAEDVGSEGSRYGSFSASEHGQLAYARGAGRGTSRPTWFDRAGVVTGTVGEPGTYFNIALSPDERRVAVSFSGGTPENRDIWVIDSARGTTSRLTFDPGDDNSPVWSPDGLRIAFQGNRTSEPNLRQKLVDGTVNDEPLTEERGAFTPTDWSSDGRFLAYQRLDTTTDIWVLPLTGDRKPIPIAQSPFVEIGGVFSPDGRWIAYQSDETGQTEVYVQPFPPTGGKYQVSKNGGGQPSWRGDGKEMFFFSLDSRMMAVSIDTTHQFAAGIPQALFASRPAAAFNGRQYAVTRDGKRFLVNLGRQQPSSLPITVVVNWLAAVQK